MDINQAPPGDEGWTVCGGLDDEEDSSNGATPRKKLRLSKEQSRLLEESFTQNHSLNPVSNQTFQPCHMLSSLAY